MIGVSTVVRSYDDVVAAADGTRAGLGAVTKVTGCPLDGLQALARRFGRVIPAGVGMASDILGSDTYEIKVRNGGQGMTDAYGELILSTTPRAFDLHTDGYNMPEPPRYVLMLRTDDSDELPESWFTAEDAVDRLPPDLVALLERPVFPSAHGPVPVLTRGAAGWVLRWNPVEVARWAARTAPVALDAVREALERLPAELRAATTVDHLRRGEAYVIDNSRVCHGRSPLLPESRRVVQRAWVADGR